MPLFLEISRSLETEDLKIYGEAAILGLDNQTVYFDSVIAPGDTVLMKAPEANQYYDSLVDRIPYMVGINLPTNPLLELWYSGMGARQMAPG